MMCGGRSSGLGYGRPITAASATAGWRITTFSISIEQIHSLPDLVTSLARSLAGANSRNSQIMDLGAAKAAASGIAAISLTV
jgi:hypothetical protein